MQLHHNKFADKIIKAAGLVTAIGILGSALNNFDLLPVFAKEFNEHTSDQTTKNKKYTREQAILAVQVYTNKYRSLIYLPTPKDPIVRRFWQDDIEEARRERIEAEKQKIEFSK